MEYDPLPALRLRPGELLYDAVELEVRAVVDVSGKIEVDGRLFSTLTEAMAYVLGLVGPVSPGLCLRFWHCQSKDGAIISLLKRLALSTGMARTESAFISVASTVSPLQPHYINTPCTGRIIMIRCPGLRAYDIEGRFIAQEFNSDVETINSWAPAFALSTIESHEYIYLGLPYHVEETFSSANVKQLLLSIPKGEALQIGLELLWQVIKRRAVSALEQGKDVLIHSGVDMGRAGYVTALLLIALGVTPFDAIEQVRQSHRYAIESFTQEKSLLALA